MKCVIVGGVAGGMSTAARLRRLDERAEIVVFERGEYISYANCGLPYYIGGVIKERSNLLVQTVEGFIRRFNVDVRVRSEVLKIDREKKEVLVRDLRTGNEYTEKYDKLVLSPGATPVKPPIPGIDLPNIFTLRDIRDTDRIKEFIDSNKPRRAVIVGAGFIGLEMAENLAHRGILVTIVEAMEQVMGVIDFEMAALVHQHLKTKNVEFYLKDSVASFDKDLDGRIVVNLSSGRKLSVDMVILSIGVRPESKLAKEAGLEIGERGHIVVNDYLQTSDPDIYAIGDAIEVYHPVIKKKIGIPLAWPANLQGRIVADNIVFGNVRRYKGSIGTAIAKVFDITVAVTGATEKLLKREGIPYKYVIIHPSSHAGYYPGALPMSLKLIFSPEDGRILGAQAVGYDGVDKRIDVLSTAIQAGLTVYDLIDLDHAYAPPYSSAKDPVNIAGYVAENVLSGKQKIITWDEFLNSDKSSIFVLDVRTKDEYDLGHIEGSVNIPVDELRNNLDKLPRDKKIIVYCGVGLRAYVACRILYQNGFEEVYNLTGGYKTYEVVTQKQGNEDIYTGYRVDLSDLVTQEPLKETKEGVVVEVDACGLQCPGPILKLKQSMDSLQRGAKVVVKATDPGFANDVKAWTDVTGNKLLSLKQDKGIIEAVIEKSSQETLSTSNVISTNNSATIIVFDDDLDKLIASFVIANGALSAGKKVSMFFTFWGLNALKKNSKVKVKKDLISKMFGMMLPKGTENLKLSKMNMFGIGPKMIRWLMKKKNISTLEELIQNAMRSGVEIVACQMSMDVMGIRREELIDGIKIGGVATYIANASNSNINLFI
ncbi:MAG: CoA-disulfide reductase [Spirochaetia bacterium]|nr:CoA-disulfide reductase [Spirochaetota bacterium]MCX8097097.1 CoA-disulfide reductase [Spirochaetota bacterium]MDW8112029.1 CoA-disulfide reductase [Spirochaetia bacterium]